MPRTSDELLDDVASELTRTLGTSLLSLSVHGSYAAGDYHPGRSDLDLLALLAADPDEATLARLSQVHEQLARDSPDWSDHIEVDYVSPTAVSDVLAGGPAHQMVRISPGEPVHLVQATSHYLLNWQSARQSGYLLAGTPVDELLPRMAAETVREVVLDHLQQWPAWVQEARRPGAQAYAVLTVCRAAATLDTGRQVSKRAAAGWGVRNLPRWVPLIEWSASWWYAGGDDQDPGHGPEVTQFVDEVSAAVLAAYGRRGQGDV